MSFWTPEEEAALDYVVIYTAQGNTQLSARSPGTIPDDGGLAGPGIPRKWQEREGYGISGSTLAYRGLGLGEFSFTCMCSTPVDRADYEYFASLIEPSVPGVPEKVYEINNPALALIGITQCVFLVVPMPQTSKGATKFTWQCKQWRKGLPTLTTPTSAAGESAKGGAADRYDQLVEERRQTISNLLGGGA